LARTSRWRARRSARSRSRSRIPPIWIGPTRIASGARHGWRCWYVNPHNRIDTDRATVEVYRAALDEYGKPFRGIPGAARVFVARSREEAIRVCAPYLGAKYRAYQQWGQNQAMPAGDNDLGVNSKSCCAIVLCSARRRGRWTRSFGFHRTTGINHLVMSVQWPGMPQNLALDQLSMLARGCIPKVRRG